MDVHLLLLAKQPRPGRVKTRLSPPLSGEQAARVARAALLDTLDVLADVPALRRTVVLDGSPQDLVPPGFAVLAQRTGDLGARLAGAYADAYADLPAPLLLIGMDTPQVTSALLAAAVQTLHSPGTDAVLGPAEDGGWWALGLHRPITDAFSGVPMSTARAGAVQQQRLTALGLRTALLPALRDIDGVADLTAVAAQLPPSKRLARVVTDLGLLAA